MRRRNFLQTAVVASTIPICGTPINQAGGTLKTPDLMPQEQETIASALSKKGTYNEAKATYSVPLPRNDLKVTVKGEPVPIPFGFGRCGAGTSTVSGFTRYSDCAIDRWPALPVQEATGIKSRRGRCRSRTIASLLRIKLGDYSS